MPRRLSNWIETYLTYTSASEAPAICHFWTAVSTVAGALRRQVWIDQRYFQWTANHYIILVAPPGIISKSTTISIGMKLLREVKEVSFGPDAVTWQALTQALANSCRNVQIDGEFFPMSCITIASSEFGTFLNPQDREMVDVLVDLWDGQIGTWKKQTKTQGSENIVNPWINVIACTTPSWIAGNLPEYMIGGGFTSRCILVYADQKRHLSAYPGLEVPQDFSTLRTDLIADLEHISGLKGEYVLSPEAVEWGTHWYNEHYAEIQRGQYDQTRFGGYMARKQTHVHKLALVLTATTSDEPVITPGTLQEAVRRVTELEGTMSEVYASIGRSSASRLTQEVYQFIRSNTAVERYQLFQELGRRFGPSEIEEGIRGALVADLISQIQDGPRTILYDRHMKRQGEGSSTTE